MERVTLRWQSGFSLLIGIAGLAVALFYIPQLVQLNIIIVLFLTVLSIMLEGMPIPLRQNLSSLLPVVPIGAMVVYGPAAAIWAVLFAGMAAPFITRDWNWLTAFFNAGQYALSVFFMNAAFGLFHITGNTTFGWPLLLAVVVAAVVFLVFNHLFINLLQVLKGTLLAPMVFSALYTDIGNLALCMPFALLMIALSPQHPILGPAMVLPIVILAYILRVHRQTRDLHLIQQATTQLASEFDIQVIAEEATRIAAQMTLADAVAVFFFNREKNVLIPTTVYPTQRGEGFWDEGYPEEEGGVIWKTIRQREVVNIPDTRKDKRVRYDTDVPEFLSMAIFPMHAHLEVQGAIVCYSEQPYAFGYSMEYVEALANQVSVLFENARLYQELEERTRRDGATELYNYRYFYEELGKRVAKAMANRTPLSILIVDVDFFKKFNDTYGHLAGDAVLKEVGQLLERACGEGAFAARYGGEEFALLLPTSEEEAYDVAESIREAVRELSIEFHGYKLQGITVSIGIASCPVHSETDRDLLLKADSAMYWGAKQRGRNRTAMYSPDFDAQLFVDNLTGLFTFHQMNIRVRDDIAQGVTSWGVICLDLREFGQVNNAFGFDVGDTVLQQTGFLIRESLRHAELACRYGGDEILIVLPSVTLAEVAGVQERVTRAISTHRYQAAENVVLSLRIDVTCQVLDDVHDGADLFNRVADLFAHLEHEEGHSMA